MVCDETCHITSDLLKLVSGGIVSVWVFDPASPHFYCSQQKLAWCCLLSHEPIKPSTDTEELSEWLQNQLDEWTRLSNDHDYFNMDYALGRSFEVELEVDASTEGQDEEDMLFAAAEERWASGAWSAALANYMTANFTKKEN